MLLFLYLYMYTIQKKLQKNKTKNKTHTKLLISLFRIITATKLLTGERMLDAPQNGIQDSDLFEFQCYVSV